MPVIKLTKETFDSEVMSSDKPVLVDFWASWCGPCRMLSPIVDQVAAAHADVKVGKVNVDEEDTLAEQFRVNAIPAIFLFKNGKVAATSLGYKSKDALLKELGL